MKTKTKKRRDSKRKGRGKNIGRITKEEGEGKKEIGGGANGKGGGRWLGRCFFSLLYFDGN